MPYSIVSSENRFNLGTYYFDFILAALAKNYLHDSLLSHIIYFLEEMFDIYPDGFAKHFEYREDQEQLHGACWYELLEVSRYKFRQAFDVVGVYYSSEEDFEASKDKFNGKPYVCVFKGGKSRRTYYYRNHELIKSLVGELVEIARSGA